MKNMKKAAIVAALTGGLAIASGGAAFAWDGGADGAAAQSPGVVSGNVIQVPVRVPVNACGTTVSVIGLLNPAFGESCVSY